MGESTLVKRAAIAALVGLLTLPAAFRPASAQNDMTANISDRVVAFSRQKVRGAGDRTRQLNLINDRLTKTRSFRLRGRNANSNSLAIRFRGGAPDKSAVFNTRNYIAPEKKRRTPRVAVWFGGDITMDSARWANERASAFHTDGVAFGVDARLGPRVLIGNAIGTGFDRTQFGEGGSLGSRYISDTLYGSFFTSANSYVDMALGASVMDFSNNYDEPVEAAGQRSGNQIFASARYSHDFKRGRLTIRPYGQTRISRAAFNEYAERGSEDLLHESRTAYEAQIAVGISGNMKIASRVGMFRPRADIQINSTRAQTSAGTIAPLQNPADEYSAIAGTSEASGRLAIGTGVDWTLSKHATINASHKLTTSVTAFRPQQKIGARLKIRF